MHDAYALLNTNAHAPAMMSMPWELARISGFREPVFSSSEEPRRSDDIVGRTVQWNKDEENEDDFLLQELTSPPPAGMRRSRNDSETKKRLIAQREELMKTLIDLKVRACTECTPPLAKKELRVRFEEEMKELKQRQEKERARMESFYKKHVSSEIEKVQKQLEKIKEEFAIVECEICKTEILSCEAAGGTRCVNCKDTVCTVCGRCFEGVDLDKCFSCDELACDTCLGKDCEHCEELFCQKCTAYVLAEQKCGVFTCECCDEKHIKQCDCPKEYYW